jgi:anti-anti-sigma factor
MADKAAVLSTELFDIELHDDTVVMTPLVNLSEFDFDRIETAAGSSFELLNRSGVKNIVVDFHKTDYYGSTALGFFVKLWKRVRKQGGHMAFCNVSDHEKEILQIAHLDHLWSVAASRADALQAVRFDRDNVTNASVA